MARYGPEYFSADSPTSDNTTKAVNWTLVAGMIALAIAGVVISGAFAVGARRQLVTLGQLSANGAGEGLLKRMLSLQGAWAGVLGTSVGLAAGVTTLTLMHGHFNSWIHRDIGPLVWSPRDLIAIAGTGVLAATIAAYVPCPFSCESAGVERARRPPAARCAPPRRGPNRHRVVRRRRVGTLARCSGVT